MNEYAWKVEQSAYCLKCLKWCLKTFGPTLDEIKKSKRWFDLFSHHQNFNVIDWTCILLSPIIATLFWDFWLIHKFINKRFTFRSLNQVFCFYCEARRRIFVFKLVNLFKKYFGSYLCCWKFEKAFSTHKILGLETDLWDVKSQNKS